MKLTFREATRADVPAVIDLLADDRLGKTRELGTYETYLAAFDDITAEHGNRVIVGTDAAGTILATYQLTFISGLSLAATRRAQVESVRVARSARGHGVGRSMFLDVENRAQAAGCGLIQLTMNADRTESHEIYQALGFTPSHVGFKRYLD